MIFVNSQQLQEKNTSQMKEPKELLILILLFKIRTFTTGFLECHEHSGKYFRPKGLRIIIGQQNNGNGSKNT